VILGQNPPEIAYWERGEWWLAGDAKPWQPEAVTVVSAMTAPLTPTTRTDADRKETSCRS
jgi:hypothetical protein